MVQCIVCIVFFALPFYDEWGCTSEPRTNPTFLTSIRLIRALKNKFALPQNKISLNTKNKPPKHLHFASKFITFALR